METFFCFKASLKRAVKRGWLGATLNHGSAGHKMFGLLFQLWLQFGQSSMRFKKVLMQVRSITSDFGVERLIGKAYDCVDAWLHYAAGHPPVSTPAVNTCQRLFPMALRIPGWNHLWSNAIKTVVEAQPGWPRKLQQLKALCRFFKVADYRAACSRHMGTLHISDVAELAKPFRGSFHKMRFETLANAFSEVKRLRDFLTQRFTPAMVGPTEDGALLAEVAQVCEDQAYFAWVTAMDKWIHVSEKMRLWGNKCSCHGPNEDCPLKGRRLHEARAKIDDFCEQMHVMRSIATTDMFCHDPVAHASFLSAIALLISTVRLRFAWLFDVPYLFSEAVTMDGAGRVLTALHRLRHEQVDPVISHWQQWHQAGVEMVAAGGAPNAALAHEVSVLRLSKMDESPVEGVHRDISGVAARCHAARLPHAFAQLRYKKNIAKVLKTMKKPSGKILVAKFWSTYKNIVRVQGRHGPGKKLRHDRPVRMRFSKFKKQFYQLDPYSVGDISHLCSEWHDNHVTDQALDASESQRVKEEYTRAVLTSGSYFTLMDSQGEMVCLQALMHSTGMEKLTHGTISSRTLVVQHLEVWG